MPVITTISVLFGAELEAIECLPSFSSRCRTLAMKMFDENYARCFVSLEELSLQPPAEISTCPASVNYLVSVALKDGDALADISLGCDCDDRHDHQQFHHGETLFAAGLCSFV